MLDAEKGAKLEEYLEIFGDKDKEEFLVENLLKASEGRGFQLGMFDCLSSARQEIASLLKRISDLPPEIWYQRFRKTVAGKERDFAVPNREFGVFCEKYLLPFIKQKKPHDICHGWECGWTPRKSLAQHLPCKCALSFDLKDAFVNTSEQAVFDFYYSLLEGDETLRTSAAEFLTFVSTVYYEQHDRRGIPQGAGFSPKLFNRFLGSIDDRLARNSQSRGMRVSRWGDDITITSPCDTGLERFLGAVDLVDREFPVSRNKLYFQDSSMIFLLGNVIVDYARIEKNSPELKQKYKTKPLEFDKYMGKGEFEVWT